MSELEATRAAPRDIGRRTIVKGAAWAVPVIAAAVVTPFAAATVTPAPLLRIDAGCLLNVSGANIGRGFFVTNSGTASYPSTITVTETITLSGLAALAPARPVIWGALAVQGILGGSTTGVTFGAWSGNGASTTRSRTVTITGPLDAGQTRSWGVPLDAIAALETLSILTLGGISHTASITSPTGNPPVIKASDAIDWRLLSTGC